MTLTLEGGQTIQLDGVRTRYFDIGEGDPVVLIHGSSPGNEGQFAWATITPSLIARQRVIVVDAPGYGESDMLAVADTPANVGTHIGHLLDRIGVERFAVVGHSRGGRIAVEMVAAFPGRVTRLAIICSGSVAPQGHTSEDGKWTEAATAIVGFGADGDSSFEAFAKARRGSVHDPACLPDDLLRPYYEKFMATRYDEWVRRMKEFDPLAFYHSEDAEAFLGKLRAIRVPTMVVAGREDKIGRWDRSLPLIDMIDDIEFHVLAHCGHFPQLERPAALSALLADFLVRSDRR